MTRGSSLSGSKARTLVVALAALGVQVALGLLLARIYLTSQNTLHNNGRWISTKATVSRGLMGAESFRRERQALARNRLNLGAWHGHQEVLLAEPVSPEKIRLRFKLEPGAWLAINLDRPEKGPATMLRFGTTSRRRSAHLKVRPSGEFVHKAPFMPAKLAADTWYEIELDYSARSVAAQLERQSLGEFDLGPGPERRIGFHGSARETLIDDVEIWSGGRRTFVERFDGPRHALRITLWIIGAVVLFNSLVIGSTFVLAAERRFTAHLIVTTASTTLIVILALVLGFVHLKGSSYPFAEDLEIEETQTRAREIARIRARVRRNHTPKPDPGVHRLLLVGSSQTWGAGAARAHHVWGAVLQKRLNADPVLEGRFECINAGVSSARARHLAPVVRLDWLRLEPRTVVITLGTNDTALDNYEEHLGLMVDSILAAGVDALLVLEPNSPDYADHRLGDRHEVMRRVGTDRGVPVLDMHGYLKGRFDDGFLWWDLTHLSSFGQSLFAERLHRELVELGLVG